MGEQDGSYIYLIWGDGLPDAEYIKGHVSAADALQALRDSHEFDAPDSVDDIEVTHAYGRWVFSEWPDYTHELQVRYKPQQGRFKITEVKKLCYAEPCHISCRAKHVNKKVKAA